MLESQQAYQRWLKNCGQPTNWHDNVPFGYLVVGPDFYVLEANQQLLDWTGKTSEQVIGQAKFADLVTMGGRIFFETHHLPLEKLQGYTRELNYTLLGANRERSPVLINTQQVQEDDGRLLFTQYFLFKISERKNYERELIKARKSAEVLNEAKNQFISTVSHEIRTPLHAIISTSDLLLKEKFYPSQSRLLNTLRLSANQLLALINDVLDFSKGESSQQELDRKSFSVKEAMEQLVDIHQDRAQEKGLSLTLELDSLIPDYLLGDVVKLTQIINNLVGNALKFTREGGVTLSVKVLSLNEQQVQLRFRVSDTGVGIPPAALEYVFQPFSTVNSSMSGQEKGTGLGLSIVHKLVQLHNSEIEVESHENVGTTFAFNAFWTVSATELLPIDFGEEDTNTDMQSYRLLMAEDNPTNRFLASRYFDRWGLHCDMAENGEQAVEMVKDTYYHLVLMDLRMPVMDGYAATRTIRAMAENPYFQTVPIVALTAYTTASVWGKAQESGINLIMQKPFRPGDLQRVIRQYALSDEQLITHRESSPMKGIQFSNLEEEFGEDATAMHSFLEVMYEDLQTICQEVKEAIAAQHLSNYRSAIHRTHTSLILLEANYLKQQLVLGKEYIEQPIDQPERQQWINDTLPEFEHLLNCLQEKLAAVNQ